MEILKFIGFMLLVIIPIVALLACVRGKDDILVGEYELTSYEEFKEGRLEPLPNARAHMIILRGHVIRIFPVITEPGSPTSTTYIYGRYETFPSSKTEGLMRVITDNGDNRPQVFYFGYAWKKGSLELSEYIRTQEYYAGAIPLRKYFWRTYQGQDN